MAAISGILGSVTFASGYTTLAHGWSMNIEAVPQDITGLSPAGNHQQLETTGLLSGASGMYRCKLAVVTASAMTGPYVTDPEEFTLVMRCEARETTPLGATWRTFIAGLLSTQLTEVSYIDGTTPIPATIAAGTAVVTLDSGRSYSVPYIVTRIDGGVDTEDVERRLTVEMLGSSAPTPTGLATLIPGINGAFSFVAEGARLVSGTLLVTGVTIRVNRRTSEGSIEVAYVCTGTVTGA